MQGSNSASRRERYRLPASVLRRLYRARWRPALPWKTPGVTGEQPEVRPRKAIRQPQVSRSLFFLAPLETPLLKTQNVPDCQNHQKYRHFGHAEPLQLTVPDRPWE